MRKWMGNRRSSLEEKGSYRAAAPLWDRMVGDPEHLSHIITKDRSLCAKGRSHKEKRTVLCVVFCMFSKNLTEESDRMRSRRRVFGAGRLGA